MTLRERLEGMLRPGSDGMLPCYRCGAYGVVYQIENTDAYAAKCRASGKHSFVTGRSRAEVIAAYNAQWPMRITSALLLAIDTVPCDQDLHARHRESECDRCVLETQILAIIEGKVTT